MSLCCSVLWCSQSSDNHLLYIILVPVHNNQTRYLLFHNHVVLYSFYLPQTFQRFIICRHLLCFLRSLTVTQSCTLMLCCMLGQLPSLQAGSWHTDCLRARRTPSWTTPLSPQWCSATHPSERWASQKVRGSFIIKVRLLKLLNFIL